jgi:hypothetical protein
VIIVQGNGIVRIMLVNKKLEVKTRRPQVLVYYDMMEGLTNEEEDLIFEIKPELFSISIINILDEKISLLNVGVTKIRINGEFEPKQGISYQRVIKTIEFNVTLETSLENKVYPKIYYHHNQTDIEMDETSTKIQV